MSNTMFERLGIAPLLVHMMWEKIARLPGMENDVCLRYRAAVSMAGVAGLELFVVLLHFSNRKVATFLGFSHDS